MFFDFDPGDYVVNPNNSDWGIGQVQSIINNIVTVNFTNAGIHIFIEQLCAGRPSSHG